MRLKKNIYRVKLDELFKHDKRKYFDCNIKYVFENRRIK